MGFEANHALATKGSQGFAHRGDADAEFGGSLVEPDEGTWAQRAGHDANAQVRRHFIGHLFMMNPLGRCVHGPSLSLPLAWGCPRAAEAIREPGQHHV